jgi:hypothetical protein
MTELGELKCWVNYRSVGNTKIHLSYCPEGDDEQVSKRSDDSGPEAGINLRTLYNNKIKPDPNTLD